MKLFKKVLAAALAGVLALSVLTGCNNSNSAATVTMVDALNDWAKVYGVDTTFKKGNEELRDQVQATLDEMAEDGTLAEIAAKYKDYNLDQMLCLGK